MRNEQYRWVVPCLIAVVCLGLAVSGSIAAPASSESTPYRPYQTRILPGFQMNHELGARNHWATGDLNNDGVMDMVFKHPMGLIGITWRPDSPVVLFQFNFPVEYTIDDHSPCLGPVTDVTGAGHDQVLYTLRGPVMDQWRFRVFDPPSETIVRDIVLPQGPDTRADGFWDGTYTVEAVLPAAAPSGGPLVLLGEVVRFDKYGRGLVALDARAGTIVWRFDMGTNFIPDVIWTGDLAGDSRPELVFSGNSPDNLGGEKINGTSDNESFLFVLDSDGQLVWRRRLGGYFVTPYFQMVDLDDDGAMEIVVATSYHGSDPETRDHLRILSASDGALLDELELSIIIREMKVLTDPESGEFRFLMGTRGRNVVQFRYRDDHLEPGPKTQGNDDLILIDVLDVLPEPGLEIICLRDPAMDSARLQVLGQDFQVLAEEPLENRPAGARATTWSPDPDKPVLLFSTHNFRQALTFVPSPPPPAHLAPWTGPLSIAGAAGVLLLGWMIRRRKTAEQQAIESGSHREFLLRLFKELEESSHGTLAATRGVERLVWLLEAFLNSGPDEGQNDDPNDSLADSPVLDRLRGGLADFRETVQPRLLGILSLARQRKMALAATEATESNLASFTQLIDTIHLERPRRDEMEAALPGLKAASEGVVIGFQELKNTVVLRFTTDPAEMVEQLLAQLHDNLDDTEVRVHQLAVAEELDLDCCIDPSDLRFILENLIGNALEAMAGSTVRTLTIRFSVNEGRVAIEFSDTGPGIAPVDRDRIFESGFSTREGGGLGLPRSREILEFWRGRLELLDSEAGQGAKFRVSLPAVRSMDAEGL